MAYFDIVWYEGVILEDSGVAGIVKDATGTETVQLSTSETLGYAWSISHTETVQLEDDTPGLALVINISHTERVGLEEAFSIGGTTVQDNSLEGQYRVSNDYLDRYEAYLGTDDYPDLTDDLVNNPPWDTFSTWPHELPALAPNHTYYIVIRKRDEYGLIEGNVDVAIVRIDAAGDQVPAGPSEPFSAELLPEPVGKVRFRACYNLMQDPVPADKWRVYLTSDGSTPDPEDSGDLYLQQDMGIQRTEDLDTPSVDAWSHGTVIKAIIVTYRSTDGTQSWNTDVLTYTIDLTAPDLTDGELFLGGGADG